MENSPFSPLPNLEAGSKPAESEKKDKKDSKKSKAIGSLAFELPVPTTEKTEKSNPLTTLYEASKTEKNDDSPDQSSVETIASPEDAEAKSTQKPELSADDTAYVLHEVAAERQAEVADEPVSDDAETQAAHDAAEAFYARIVDEGLPLEAAAEMTTDSDHTVHASETTESAAEDEDTAAPSAQAGGSGSSGSTPPPRVPATPGGSAPQGPHGPVPVHIPGGHPGVGPVPSGPNTPTVVTRTEYVPYYDRSRAFGDALVGGIVGYLIGRRRGRIKTERKLLPVQHKLEREVKSLSTRLAETEFAVRETAKQKLREQRGAPAKAETVVSIRGQKTAPEGMILGRREQSLPAPELHVKPNFAAPSERIGRVLIAAETVALASPAPEVARPEKRESESKTIDGRTAEQQVETLSRNELMTLSEKVIVEGSTLRQVYETHLISERGLRRLITEYLRGGDVVKAFRRELIEREIDFERDPKLRDTVRKNLTGGGASPTLNKLLQQAGVAPTDESPQEISRARAQQLRDVKHQAKRASQRKFVDVSLITIIAALVAVVVYLAAHRM